MDEKKPRKKSVSNTDNNKNKTFVKNTINLNPTIDDTIREAKSDTVVFTWGRMNPPTIGHQKLVEKVVVVARQNNAMPHVYLSQSYDSKKNPLPYKTKIRLAKRAFGNIVTESRSKTLIQVMKELQEMGHTKAIMVAGSDRVGEFKKLLNTYNGKDFSFESIQVVSAGDRDPDSDSVSGMSASKMRALAAEGNVNEFKRGLPSRLQSSADKVMQNVRDGMQIAEELEAEGLLDEAVLTIAQRRKRAMAFRRVKARIQRGRMIAQRKFAPKEKLEKRARRAAIKFIRRRVAGKKGANYANLSPGEKMSVDRLVQRRQGAIKTIAKRLMPKVRSAERERLKAYHASQSPTKEQFEDVLNIIMEAYFKVDIEGLPKFFMDAASPGEVKVELRKLLKKPGEVIKDITRVQKADIIKAFRLQAAGKDVDGEKVGVEESLDDKFTNYLFEKMTVQDPDIKDREGTQPKRFHTGLTKSAKTKRDVQFKRQEKMADDDPNAYKPAAGDDTKTQTSKYTRKYHQMFGKEQNMKFDKRFRFNKKEAMTEEELFGHIDNMFNLFEMIELEESALEGLKKKSEKSGIPYSILKKVYDRGLAAWKIGHRPGANQQQWAYARVNSFITKGKNTWGKADADLARQVRGEETELGEAEMTQVDVAREKIKREKESDKKKHDRMMDRARSSDTQTVNRSPNTEEVVHDKCGTPECCGQCGTSDPNEAFVAAGFSDIMYANDFEDHKIHGGFALHPSVTEEGGAGDWGTKKLTKKYKKDTPGEIQEAIDFMEKHNIDFCENVYRPMSEKYFEFFREARRLYEQGEINVEGVNKQLLQTDLGEFAFYEDEEVPLDCPLVEEEELNKPKRGGAKKFYVYVRDPSTGNVKKVSFGQKGMSVHINDPAARKSFAARHQCDTRNDKTTASYWACRLPRYAKMLGMQVDNPGAWW